MKLTFNILKSLTAALIMIIMLCQNSSASDTVAFGYFTNKSDNSSMDYLKQVLPNSFASALKNKHKIDSIKPAKLPVFNIEQSDFTGKEIEEKDLFELSSYVGAAYFVFGDYMPLAGNRIRLNIKVYKTHSSKVFSFTEEGELQTEIFRLVDRISFSIKNIVSESMLYKSGAIEKNSRVSIITNIEGEELNTLYYTFLKNGYKLSAVQGNELRTHLDEKNIMSLYTVSASNASYSIISDRSDVDLPHGTWAGAKYYKSIIQQRDTYNKYAFNFEKTFEIFSNKVVNFTPGTSDYFIIIGFDDDKKTAWLRCVSLKNNKLITAESKIKGSSIDEISAKIINSLRTELSPKS